MRGTRPAPLSQVVTTSDGVALSVREYGSCTAARTVVLLHGCCLNRVSWSLQIRELLRRWGTDIRIIAYDHRGHGDSGQALMNTYTVERLAADLAELQVALGVRGRVCFVGHSLGGMTALAYLGRPACDRPVEPKGLVLVATAAGRLAERGLGRLLATPAVDIAYGLVRRAPAGCDGAVRAVARPIWRQLARCGYGPGGMGRAALVEVAAGAINATPLATKAGFLRSLRGYDQYSTLAGITAKCIVVAGDADLLTPPSHARDLAAGIGGATLVQIAGAGHMLLQEAPQVITNAIDAVIWGNSCDASQGGHNTAQPMPDAAGAAS
ncbi:alpha/beta hydrolase [Mycobacterium bouchedurhonense]|uniref:Alpha/beta hydrolase n=1 Tax=Mycobacterium bouchedurhonense TaxID=701041 RepID=A0ABX3S7M5_MYCBC|nr:alpha/beta hydrolase [Mycobacterium bouchedurhonense]